MPLPLLASPPCSHRAPLCLDWVIFNIVNDKRCQAHGRRRRHGALCLLLHRCLCGAWVCELLQPNR